MLTRDNVLDVAESLFASKGFRATNLKLVADELQVTRQALYYHFRDKRDILACLFDRMMTDLETSATTAERSSPERRFFDMVHGHALVIASRPDLAAVLLHERPELDSIRDTQRRRSSYSARFVEAFTAARELGVVRPVDPVIATNCIVASANSLTWWYRPSPDYAPDAAADDFSEMIRRGYGQHDVSVTPEVEHD